MDADYKPLCPYHSTVYVIQFTLNMFEIKCEIVIFPVMVQQDSKSKVAYRNTCQKCSKYILQF